MQNDCFQTSLECTPISQRSGKQPKVRQTDSLHLKLMSLVEPMLRSQAEENRLCFENTTGPVFPHFGEINLQMACLQLYLHFKGAKNCPITWQILLKNVSLEITPVTALGSIQREGAGQHQTCQKMTWVDGQGLSGINDWRILAYITREKSGMYYL